MSHNGFSSAAHLGDQADQEELARLRAEVQRLRGVFHRAAENYPSGVQMPPALHLWWEKLYGDIINSVA